MHIIPKDIFSKCALLEHLSKPSLPNSTPFIHKNGIKIISIKGIYKNIVIISTDSHITADEYL